MPSPTRDSAAVLTLMCLGACCCAVGIPNGSPPALQLIPPLAALLGPALLGIVHAIRLLRGGERLQGGVFVLLCAAWLGLGLLAAGVA